MRGHPRSVAPAAGRAFATRGADPAGSDRGSRKPCSENRSAASGTTSSSDASSAARFMVEVRADIEEHQIALTCAAHAAMTWWNSAVTRRLLPRRGSCVATHRTGGPRSCQSKVAGNDPEPVGRRPLRPRTEVAARLLERRPAGLRFQLRVLAGPQDLPPGWTDHRREGSLTWAESPSAAKDEAQAGSPRSASSGPPAEPRRANCVVSRQRSRSVTAAARRPDDDRRATCSPIAGSAHARGRCVLTVGP
jgi:hypothetical protein